MATNRASPRSYSFEWAAGVVQAYRECFPRVFDFVCATLGIGPNNVAWYLSRDQASWTRFKAIVRHAFRWATLNHLDGENCDLLYYTYVKHWVEFLQEKAPELAENYLTSLKACGTLDEHGLWKAAERSRAKLGSQLSLFEEFDVVYQ